MPKGKKLGKGLAALIKDEKRAKDLMEKDEGEEKNQPGKQEPDEEALKKWADSKAKEKGEQDDNGGSKRKASGTKDDKKKAYEDILERYRSRKKERFEAKSGKIDEEVPVWAEDEYKQPLEFNYFDRNRNTNAKERYEKVLAKRKK